MVDRSKSEQYKNHPLNGLGLKPLLNLLVDHYGWEILDKQININCFRSKPSIASSYKFLHRTTWAREKVEAFYLYKYMQYPRPTDEQHKFSPREREVNLERIAESPASIELDDPEFFDDPISGPVFPSKESVSETRAKAKKKSPSTVSAQKTDDGGSEAIEADQQVLSRRGKVKQQSVDSTARDATEPKAKDNSTAAPDPWAKWRSE